MDEDELLASLLEGNESAGAFLVSYYAPQLLGYAHVVGPDLSVADRELVCERAVEKAVRRIGRYDPEIASFGSWLRGFVRHEILNWRRGHLPVSELNEETTEAVDRDGHSAAIGSLPDPETVVKRLIAGLSATDQIMIALRDLEGLPFGEIAARLDATESACRQRHHRALARLRAAVTQDEELVPFMATRR